MYLPVEPGRLIEGPVNRGRKIEDALYLLHESVMIMSRTMLLIATKCQAISVSLLK